MFLLFQKIIPQHLLSRFVGLVAGTSLSPVKNLFIRVFAAWYKVNMLEAERENLSDYGSFNDFFTRSLKSGARPLEDESGTWVCPADGVISAAGDMREGKLIQAKNHDYSCTSLLGDESLAQPFITGSFATVYLSPKDYHRVHMPCDARLKSYRYIPGKLFSVNQKTTENIENLFAINERLVCHFETDEGPFCLVMVGAMIVAAIKPVWREEPFEVRTPDAQVLDENMVFKKGDELGSFLLGSTVILLSSSKKTWKFQAGDSVRMGQLFSEIQNQ